jgi:non-heme chloroperoxidase
MPASHDEATLNADPHGVESWVQRPDGTRIRVVTSGSGRTVVLAHGYGVSMVEWNVVASALGAAGYRVVVFDQRGHGQSTIGADGIGSTPMAGDYLAVMEAVDARDAILAGHSMGGFLAIKALLDVPGVAARVTGLILFATFSGSVTRGSLQNRLQIPLIRSGLLEWLVSFDGIGRLFGRSIYGDAPSAAAIQAFLTSFRAQKHQALLPILSAFGEEDRAERLGEIKIPTVVICGRKDKTTPPWQSERLASSIPGAKMVWVEGAGHMVNWEAPDALVEAVKGLGSPTASP